MMNDEAGLFAQLEDVFAAVDEEEIVNLQDIATNDLLHEHFEMEELVKARRETLWPRTQEARDFHSRRNAVEVELHRRGVL